MRAIYRAPGLLVAVFTFWLIVDAILLIILNARYEIPELSAILSILSAMFASSEWPYCVVHCGTVFQPAVARGAAITAQTAGDAAYPHHQGRS